MKKILLFLASSLMLFASCAKEDSKVEPSPVDPKPEGELIYSVTVSLGDSTKATLGEPVNNERKVTWNTGDKICVNGSVSDALASTYDGKAFAEFTFNEFPIVETASYLVCYPESVYKDATHVTLPAVQGDAKGANKAIAFPMAGIATSSEGLHTIQLKQLCGFIRVKVQGNLTLSKMSFTGNNDEQVSGDFELGWDGESGDEPTLTAKETPDAADKTVSVSSSATLALGTDKYCVIAVPANTYSKGAKLSFSTSANTFDVNSPSSKTIERASVKNISTISVVEIASADAWNTFADDFNDNKYPNEGSSTFVNFTSDLDFSGKDITTITKDFKGTILGNDHAFKNISLQDQGIFNKLYGLVQKVKIDSNSRLSLTDGGTNISCGTFANQLLGTMSYCTSSAYVVFSSDNAPSADRNIGGLVGKVDGGTIEHSSMNAYIVFDKEFSSAKNWKIGGISGVVENSGKLDNCTTSNIKIQWGKASAGSGPTIQDNATFWLGGFAGHLCSGTISNCVANNTEVSGDIVSNDIRGVLGLSGFIGGIVGQVDNDGTVYNCDNKHSLYVRTRGTVDNGKCICIGGIVGENNGAVTSSPNNGGTSANVSQETLCFGGIVGKNNGSLTGSNNSANLSGPTQYATTQKAYIGGVVGYTTTALSNLANSGEVSVSTSSTTYGSATNVIRALGGVIGYADSKITLSSLTNSGKVTYDMTTKINSSGSMLGGIIGYINGPVTLSDCTNNGLVYNINFNNSYGTIIAAVNTGGIAGVVCGKNTDVATVSGCTNNSEFSCRRGIIGGICGWAQYATISSCENKGSTTVTGTNENIPAFFGGIIGKADVSTTINNNCKVENITLRYKPATVICVVGGIAGALLTSSSKIEQCVAKGISLLPQTIETARDKWGGISGTSVSGSNISHCSFSGTHGIDGSPVSLTLENICSDTNFTGSGNSLITD